MNIFTTLAETLAAKNSLITESEAKIVALEQQITRLRNKKTRKRLTDHQREILSSEFYKCHVGLYNYVEIINFFSTHLPSIKHHCVKS